MVELESRLASLDGARAVPRSRGRRCGRRSRRRHSPRSAAQLVPGAELVLDLIGFDAHAVGASLVVTGEGTVDATTLEGKAPGAVQRRCRTLGVRCELFGGIVRDGIDAHALSGRPDAAVRDLERLGEELAAGLA